MPGTFDAAFPSTDEDELLFTLLDAFAEAQFDGWFPEATATDVGIVTPDLTRGQGALVVLYASVRILQAEIRNRKTHTRYEAGPAVFEQDQSANVLTQLLKDLQARKQEMTKWARQGASADAFLMADLYVAKAYGTTGYVSWPYMVDA